MKISCLIETAGVNDYVLYHGTSAFNAYQILKTDTLELDFSEVNPHEKMKGAGDRKMFYSSTARSITSSYLFDNGEVKKDVIFTIDIGKLNRVRSVTTGPVDYWGKRDGSGLNYGKSSEKEERIWSSEPTIPRFSKLLKDIRIIVSTYTQSDGTEVLVNSGAASTLRKVYIAASRLNVPVMLFTAKGNPAGALMGKEKPDDRKLAASFLRVDGQTGKSWPDVTKGTFAERRKDAFMELVFKTSYDTLSKEAKKILWDYAPGYSWSGNLQDAFKEDVSNSRNKSASSRMFKDALVKAVKHTKVKSVDDLWALLNEKWKKGR